MEENSKKKWLQSKPAKLVLVIIVIFVAGYFLGSLSHKPSSPSKQITAAGQTVSQKWTCSMHPQIITDKPGKCPICGMTLIPLSSSVDTVARQLVVSPEAAKLMEIETSVVQRKFVENEIRMVGKIDYDETRLRNITAWVPGRIDRLYVDFTGITVSKGDHMVYLYSPELLSTQAELLQAAKAVANLKSDSSTYVTGSIRATLEAAREKMRLLGLTQQQIAEIEKTGQPVDHLTIYSPIGGVVIHKNATEGMYVDTGTPIYKVADLSKLWAKLDAYESDLPWIRYGQEVEFTTQAYPGQIFKGTISFIDPVINDKTRTVKVRVNVDNSEYKLKPEMFIRAVVRSGVAAGGMVMVPEMAGKWICPMHPDIVKSQAGTCDICGMDLVTTESLGYIKADTAEGAPLVIPASAPLVTGKRAVVYVQLPNMEKPTYQGREVTLGPRAGDYYLVKSGLSEGEVVVTNGNFKIDSALQIQAKPSMMNPQGGSTPMGHQQGGGMEKEMSMPGM